MPLNPILRKSGEGWSEVVRPTMSGIVRLAADKRPLLNATVVAGLPVRVLGFNREAGLNVEVHNGFILKANVNGVVFTGGKELKLSSGLP
jgi:hypothetical protein